MAQGSPADRLDQAVADFMRYFLVYVNPILHRTEYRGRSYLELEIIVCMALRTVGQMRPGGLSRGLRIEKGTLTSVIRRLGDLGLIERSHVPGDERGYTVRLTSEGEAFVRHLDAQRRNGFRKVFADMDPTEIDIAARGFELMTKHLASLEQAHGPATR